MTIPSWVIGSAVASVVFMFALQTGIPALGLPGLLLPPFLAFWIGAAAASLVSAQLRTRDSIIIAAVVVLLLMVFLWQVQTQLGPQGGPNL
jgi:hypothetical protein